MSSRVLDFEKYTAKARQAVAEGQVLLLNQNHVLPLPKGSHVAVFGRMQLHYYKSGTGSGGMVNVNKVTGILEALEESEDVQVYEPLVDVYREWEKDHPFDEGVGWGNEPWSQEEMELNEALVEEAAEKNEYAIVILARTAGEDKDNKMLEGAYCLTSIEEDMLQKVRKSFAKMIVLLNTGNIMDMSFMDQYRPDAVMYVWQGGMIGGLGTVDVLTGKVCPSGRLSDTIAAQMSDYPADPYFGGLEQNLYVEDIYVGYRYFETIPGAREKVNYPFGFGLSYTTFEVKPLEAGENHGNIQVRVQVTNTGSCAGKEVVQIYVGKPQGKLGKPDKELVAFEKTRLLQTGESQLLLLQWKVSDMASFDDLGKVKKAAYVLEKGTYVIYAGTSVRDVEKLSYSYVLEEDVITEQLTTKLAPTSLKKRMLADGTFEELPLMQANDPNASEIGKLKDEQTDGFTPEGKLVESYVLWRGMHRSGEHDFTEVADGTITMEEFLAQLSVEELAYLLGGQPNTGVANTFGFGNFPEYEIPDIMTADGPAGLRIAPEAGVNTTAFPCATLLACTWNPEIVERIGEAGGAEVKENNISVWLTPAINIHRSPLCGRNFEYYSEDPLLTAELAGAMVKGIQSNHIGATLKHFACNNKETNRKNCDSRVSERAAREIYLKAFERIVKEQKPWAVMSSYNIMNGHRTSEYKELLTGVLREEWGFSGMVTTDWWTCGEHYKETHAGNDLKMPRGFADRLMEAVRQGCLTREEMETSVGRILKTILKVD